MMRGIDNVLVTKPIVLTNSESAYLFAKMRFNLNSVSGAPPDGFRVEVSPDNGVTWTAINLGVRTGMGVSGTDNSGTTSNTGHNLGNNWIRTDTLTRLNIDLSGWAGKVVLIRFRVTTTNAAGYNAYEDNTAGFGGFYLDDVVVWGESVQEG